jgi:hypothetical protein
VIAFGRTLLQDLYSSSPLAATFIPGSSSPEDGSSTDKSRSNILRQAPTFGDINKYFTLITPLKYCQPHQPTPSQFSAPIEGLTLTAYNSGHTLGGTIWHIQHGMESIVYAVDWNQARENVIAGAAWFGGVGGAEVEGHITVTSLASFRSFFTFVLDGLIEDMAALLELQWHQVVLAHSLATCSAISLFAKLDHRDGEYREWILLGFSKNPLEAKAPTRLNVIGSV